MKEFILILVTCSSPEEAEKIGNSLVEKRLAACVNVVPEVKSIFYWKGKVSKEKEVLLIVKSRMDLFESIQNEVKGLHSYEVPEIIALPIEAGSEEYLNWIRKETQK
ncbi:MAG: divalent-cation tolerance protein CutA [Candidatus Zixiibacteriota bacterium]